MTVSIKYHPRIAKVLLDSEKVKEIEDYYKKCADDGATAEDVEAKAMVSKPYAKVLKEAFPNATFVGFTGTPMKRRCTIILAV